MAAEMVTPTDPESGLPYAIAPKCERLSFNRTDIADDHHGWHPRTGLVGSIAGLALRNSWMQFIEKDLHNEGPFSYHRYYKGPELPINDTDTFGRIVLACAGYIPNEVIDMTSESVPMVRPATPAETAFLHKRDRNDPFGYRYLRYGYDPIRTFFFEYISKRGLPYFNETTVSEFLFTPDPKQKVRLGNHLLWLASEEATGEIRDKYKRMAKGDRLHPLMPKDPKPLVKWKLGGKEHVQQRVIPKLERVLLTSIS